MTTRLCAFIALLLPLTASPILRAIASTSVAGYLISLSGGTIPFRTDPGRSETGTVTYPANDDTNVNSTDAISADLLQGDGGLTPPIGSAVFVVGVTVYGAMPADTPVTADVHFTGAFTLDITAGAPIDTSKAYVVYTLDRNDVSGGSSTWTGPSSIGSVTASGLSFSAPLPVKEPGHYCAFVVVQVGLPNVPLPSASPESTVGEELFASVSSQDYHLVKNRLDELAERRRLLEKLWNRRTR